MADGKAIEEQAQMQAARLAVPDVAGDADCQISSARFPNVRALRTDCRKIIGLKL